MQVIIARLKQIEQLREKYKNSYLWNYDNGNSSYRKIKEENDRVSTVTWVDNNHTYTAEFSVDISRRNVYVNAFYTKDGIKTTWIAIRNSMKRLEKKYGTQMETK